MNTNLNKTAESGISSVDVLGRVSKGASAALAAIIDIVDAAEEAVKSSGAWFNSEYFLPDKDGDYMVITPYNSNPRPMHYTIEGGWNTYHSCDGELQAEHVIKEIVAWYKMPDPPKRYGRIS